MTRSNLLGFVFGLLAATSWGTSPILIRKGLEGLPSALWGTAIGLFVAMVIYLIWLTVRRGWLRPTPEIRTALKFQMLAGVGASVGIIGRNVALQLAPVVVIIPLSQTTTLFTLILAPLLLGTKLERVSVRLVIGALLVVGGAVLIVVGPNR